MNRLTSAYSDLKGKLVATTESQRAVARNAGWVFLLRIIQKISALAMMYFLVRGLSQEQFAFFNLVLTAISLLSVFTLPELTTTVTQSVARGFPGTYRRIMPLSFGASWLGSLCLLGVALWLYLSGEPQEQPIAFVLTAILFPFSMGLQQWKGFKKGMEDFKGIARLAGQVHIIQTIFITLAIVMYPGNVIIPICIYMMAGCFRNVLQTVRALRLIPKDAPAEENSQSYGIKASLISVVNLLANNIDKLLLYFFISPVQMAILVAAEKIPELMKNMIQDMGNVVMPRFAKQASYSARIDKILKFICLGIGAGIAAFAFLIFPYLSSFIFGEQYDEAIPYGIILLLTIALGNLSVFRMRFVMSKLDLKSFKDITLAMSAVRIVSSAIAVPLMGLPGAILSAVLYRLAMIVIVTVIFKKRYSIAEPTP